MILSLHLRRWLFSLLLVFATFATHAAIWPIHAISLGHDDRGETEVVLPHFLRQPQSGHVQFDWSVKLPAALHNARLPALLLPQPVQGATFWIGDELIHEIASSDAHALRNWYSPILISIPRHLLTSSQDTVVRVRQAGYLRGWFVAPMFTGELADLRPWFDGYALLSQTLSVTINVLSGLIGLFLLGLGWRIRAATYIYSGLATMTWSLLFSLALLSEIPAQHWFYWRLTLYLCTGWLIWFISLFLFRIFEQRVSRVWHLAYFIFLNLGWLVFGIGREQTERVLDLYWTGLAVGIYIATTIWLILLSVRQGKIGRLVPFLIHALTSSAFAFHDYILQAGWLPFPAPTQAQPLWVYALLQPVYLTHLALPSFVIMALWMLAQDHFSKTKATQRHERQLQLQREQMISDIHDGVGSRINFLLWGLRTSAPPLQHIELELQRCMDELRFAINPIEAGHETLHKALQDLCSRLQGPSEHLQIFYTRTGAPGAVPPDLGIQLYKSAQECLNNAIRHSQATRLDVELAQTPHEVRVTVIDNGVGIPHWCESTQSQTLRKPSALGLESLKRRMQGKGGSALIQSSPLGTCVVCTIPLVSGARRGT